MKILRISYFACFAFLLAGLFPLSAVAAGFDCKKAGAPLEKLICMDYRLSDLDEQLAQVYAEALDKAADKTALKANQKRWLAQRGKCAKFECVMQAYMQRIGELAPGTKPVRTLDLPQGMPWDFQATSGFTQSGLSRSKRDIDALLVTEYKWSPETKSKNYQIINFVTRQKSTWEDILQLPSPDQTRSIQFGPYKLGWESGSYTQCRGEIESTGLRVEKSVPPANAARQSVKHLLALKRENWSVYLADSEDCPDTSMDIRLVNFFHALFWKQNLFLSDDKEFIVRFDENLNTGSKLVGKKVFLPWAEDIAGLTKDCTAQSDKSLLSTTEHYICVDTQLKRLIETVQRFYQ